MENVNVLDLSSVLAGPLTGSFFAELGAKVLKIENKKTGGDVTRQWKLASESPDSPYSAYYFSANFGKETILLDLSEEEDRAWLEKQFSAADIVISNFQKKTAEKLGVTPDQICSKYPSLIFAQLNAFDWDDPRPGYDLVMQAETGWISMTGTDWDHLSKLPVALMDVMASHQLREGILLALLQRQKTGVGSQVHVSLFKSALAALANQASNYLMTGHVPKPLGTLHPNIVPYGDLFLSSDNQLFMLALGSDYQFRKLTEILGLEESDGSRFQTNADRVKYRSEVTEILGKSFKSSLFSDISDILDRANVPYCRIKKINEVLDDVSVSCMINERKVDGVIARSMSTVAFDIYKN